MRCPNCGNELIDDAAFCPRCARRVPGAPSYNRYAYAAFISYRHGEGDRYGAIRSALQALPSESDPDRPVVDEAQEALETALEVNVKGSYWLSSYAIDMPADIVCSAYAPQNGWFALMDEDFNIRTFDLVTGKPLATCAVPGGLTGGDAGASEDLIKEGEDLIANASAE